MKLFRMLSVLVALAFTVSGFAQIDTFTTETKVVPNPVVFSNVEFGHSVALSGNTAVVGAPMENNGAGVVYVFTRTATTWVRQAKLVARDAAPFQELGFSVSISSNTIVAGAPTLPSGGIGTGATYVFVRQGTNWVQQAKLIPPDAGPTDQFGWAVGISSNTLVSGAIGRNDAGAQSGAAFVFVRNGTNWNFQAKLMANDAAAQDLFGNSVGIDGNTTVIGRRDRDQGGPLPSAAYVFVRTGARWSQQQKLVPPDTTGGFGDSIAISRNTVTVGADFDNNVLVASGAAYVFVRAGTNWFLQQKLKASDVTINQQFGNAVSIETNELAIGAVADNTTAFLAGAAYFFARTNTTWTEQFKLLASDTVVDNTFGFSVAVQGQKAVIGAPHIVGVGTFPGAAYIFENTNPPTATNSALTNITLTNITFINNTTNTNVFLTTTNAFVSTFQVLTPTPQLLTTSSFTFLSRSFSTSTVVVPNGLFVSTNINTLLATNINGILTTNPTSGF